MLTLFMSLALATAPDAAGTKDTRAATEIAAKPKKQPKICRTVQRTGRVIKKRVCKTQEQWLAEDSSGTIDSVNQGYKGNKGNGSTGL